MDQMETTRRRVRPEISESRTFADISGHSRRAPEPEEASKPRLGPDSLVLEGFLIINHHVASVALLDLSTSNGMLSGTIDMVERCFTSWQVGSVSGQGRGDCHPGGTPQLYRYSCQKAEAGTAGAGRTGHQRGARLLLCPGTLTPARMDSHPREGGATLLRGKDGKHEIRMRLPLAG